MRLHFLISFVIVLSVPKFKHLFFSFFPCHSRCCTIGKTPYDSHLSPSRLFIYPIVQITNKCCLYYYKWIFLKYTKHFISCLIYKLNLKNRFDNKRSPRFLFSSGMIYKFKTSVKAFHGTYMHYLDNNVLWYSCIIHLGVGNITAEEAAYSVSHKKLPSF